jgi:c-di-GMP-binding flagellar brake protein YcgR
MLTQGTSGTGRRKSSMERIAFATAIQYEPADESRRFDLSCDLSQGGLYLRSGYTFDTDETLALSFTVPKPGQEITISCQARVAWTNTDTDRRKIEYPPGAGLQFLDIANEDRSALARFIETYDENKKMDVVCAWCGRHLGLRKGPLGKTSHGICIECRETLA